MNSLERMMSEHDLMAWEQAHGNAIEAYPYEPDYERIEHERLCQKLAVVDARIAELEELLAVAYTPQLELDYNNLMFHKEKLEYDLDQF